MAYRRNFVDWVAIASGTWTWTQRLLLVLGLAILVLYTVQRYLVFPRHATAAMNGVPGPLAGAELVTIKTSDGETLAGYWHAPDQGMPIVVSFHGNGSSPIPHAERFVSPPWSTHGWGVMTIAYRGYPGSSGSPSQQGLIVDALAAVAYAKARAPGHPIVLHGHSLGTGVALAVASPAEPMAIILEAAYTSLVDVASAQFPVVSHLLWDKFPADAWIKSADAPIEIIHGNADPVIPVELARRLSTVKPGTVLTVVPGADHVSVFGSQDVRIESELRSMMKERRGR